MLAVTFVAGCDYLVENYEFDTEGYGQSNWEMLDYCESPAANAYDNYSKAMRLAGLDEVVAEGGYTCIIPNNDAFTSFVSAAGYASLDEVPGPVLRDLLSYLIFPGDYRATTMEVGEECTVNSLRGEPITISRSASEKSYTLTINGVNGLAGITVESQDYLFKNNVVGQMVEQMPYYKPSTVPQTDPVPEDYVSNGESITIPVSEDTYLYGSGSAKTASQDNNKNGLRIRNQSGYYGFGLLRFRVPQNNLMEDLVLAKVCMTVYKLEKYYTNNPSVEVNVSLHDINDVAYNVWDEKTATFSSICETLLSQAEGVASNKGLNYLIKGEGGIKKTNTFVVGDVNFPASSSMPHAIEVPMTTSVKQHYETGTKDEEGNVIIDYVIYNKEHGSLTSNLGLYIHDKDYYKNGSTLVLKGPEASKLSIAANNPLVTTDVATAFTPDVLTIATPDATNNPEGYDYSSQNIVLQVAEEPANGTLTLYGIPMHKYATFTYYEMANNFVKYVRHGEAQEDSFKVKVFDYLNCMILNPVTINVQ